MGPIIERSSDLLGERDEDEEVIGQTVDENGYTPDSPAIAEEKARAKEASQAQEHQEK